MKTTTILFIAGLIISSIIGLAQTSNAQISNSVADISLNVSLAPNNPPAGTLNYPKTAVTSQAIVLSVRFTAGAGDGFTISELRFHKNGDLPDSSISMAYLVEIDAPLYKSNTITNGVIEFNNLSFKIAAGQTRTLLLVIDTLSGLPVGMTTSFSLNTANDVTVFDTSRNIIAAFGSFPVIGNIFTIIPISNFPLTTPTAQQSAIIFPPKETDAPARCGVYSYKFYNQCDGSTYRNVYAQCFDGFAITEGDGVSCKSYEILTKFADDACANRCPSTNRSESLKILEPAIPEKAVPGQAPIQNPTPTTSISTPTTAATSPNIKCGVNSFAVSNECGAGVYKNVFAQCYDGFVVNMGEASSCKPTNLWNQYVKEACVSHCSKEVVSATVPATVSAGGGYGTVSTETSSPIFYYKDTGEGGNRSTPLGPSSVPVVEREWVSVCTTIPILMQNYNELVLELQNPKLDQLKKENLTKSIANNKQYTEEVKKACATDPQSAWQVAAPPKVTENIPIYTQESKPVSATTKPVEIPRTTPVCYVSDNLMQKYSQLIVELQKSESDKTRTEEITKQIIELKQQISTQQKECINTAPQQTSKIIQPASTVPQLLTENKPVAVAIDRCNEVAQWETKIVYYKKLGNLSEDELRKSGFSREEIENILQELSSGSEKVRAQCNGQVKTSAIPRGTAITGLASISETIKPVVIESGQEIGNYYKARLEKAVSAKGEEKQIQELKTLRDEIDGLISNLIKSRKELEVSELNSLVKEVTVSRGEIKADDISVKTTEKKMLVNIGDRPVSVEPTVSQVLIRDKGLEVNTNEVTIKENVLSVGGVDVKMSASEVTEKLGLVPTTIELREEDNKAVYNITIDEQRKLFGFIQFNSQKIVIADAENGNTLSEQLPWYNFLTTK